MKDKKKQALKCPLTSFAAVEVLTLLFYSISSLNSSGLLCSKASLLSVFQHCYQLEITFHLRMVFFSISVQRCILKCIKRFKVIDWQVLYKYLSLL